MYIKTIIAAILVAGTLLAAGCGNHAGPSGTDGKDSAKALVIKDDTLAGFLLGGVYFFQGYGGTEKTTTMVQLQAKASPGDKNFISELHKAYNSLMVFPYKRSAKETPDSKKVLSEWWNAHNKQEFDAMQLELKEHGHQQLFERCKKALDENGGAGADIARIDLKKYGLTAEHDSSLAFVKAHYSEFTATGIKAWDIARYVSNVCMGYSAAYLEKEEGIQLIMAVLAESRRLYPDWKAYYKDFILGRAFWGGHKDDNAVFESIVQTMQQGDYSIYRYLPLK